jgi:O-antigen/teichoic acid export membrane protein
LLRRFWAMFERMVPRGLGSLAAFAAAAVTDPQSFGLYNWAVLVLSLFGTITDTPIRYLAAENVGCRSGRRYLRRYAVLSGVVGLVVMTCGVWLVASLAYAGPTSQGLALLCPLILIPPAQALAVQPVAQLQREGRWGQVSLFRVISSLLGVAIGIPVVFLSRSVFGACIALMLAELSFAALILIQSAKRDLPSMQTDQSEDDVTRFWSTYRHMATYTSLGWLQGQSERVFLGLWAGTSVLGTYSLGSAIGRIAADPINDSQAGVLRIDLANAARSGRLTDETIRAFLRVNLRAAIPLAAAGAICVALIAEFILAPLFGPEWAPAFEIIPILALTGIPLAVAAASAPVHVQRGRSRVAYIGPAICLLFAPAIAISAMTSLALAAWLVLLKDCFLACIQAVLMGRVTPWPEVAFAGFLVAVGSSVTGMLSMA